MPIDIQNLHPMFGVIVEDVDLGEVTKDNLYPEIRDLFENHSAILFTNQIFSEDTHIRFAKLFGPLENREELATNSQVEFQLPKVSNQKEGGAVYGEFDMETLDLKGNMLWHTDSTFLPIPALANIIAAKVLPSSGGQTELVSTKVTLRDLPKHLYKTICKKKFWHSLSYSRKKIHPDLAKENHIRRWKPQKWDSILKNPVTGAKSLYIASHTYKIEGMTELESEQLIDEIIGFCTQEKYVYSHNWKLGDVLIWDERAILHRGRPWPYSEPRTLASICVSLREQDGLALR
tara:strand:+ start:166 stop:1035 length:870 start_codon:yes stop_codon:yes gene_type:complete